MSETPDDATETVAPPVDQLDSLVDKIVDRLVDRLDERAAVDEQSAPPVEGETTVTDSGSSDSG